MNTDHVTLMRARTKILSLLTNLIKEGFEIKIAVLDKEKGIRILKESLETEDKVAKRYYYRKLVKEMNKIATGWKNCSGEEDYRKNMVFIAGNRDGKK